MAFHNDLGNKGERVSQQFLIDNGYTILAINYRYRKAEIDIIAKEGNEVVFIEVKTRSSENIIKAEEAVGSKKKQLFMEAANHYMENMNDDSDARFDIISVIFTNSEYTIRHIKDAFNSIF